MYQTKGISNCTKWIGLTPTLYLWEFLPQKNEDLECKISQSTLMCIALCHVLIICVRSTSLEMLKPYIHSNIHEHHVLNGTCHESLDMTYHCIVNEVMKTPPAKNCAIVMGVSKQFLTYYLHKFPPNDKGHHLVGSSLEVILIKFSTLASTNYCNFVSGSKCFVCSGTCTIDSIMTLKDHSGFKYVHDNIFLGQFKDKVFVLKMSIYLFRLWCESC